MKCNNSSTYKQERPVIVTFHAVHVWWPVQRDKVKNNDCKARLHTTICIVYSLYYCQQFHVTKRTELEKTSCADFR